MLAILNENTLTDFSVAGAVFLAVVLLGYFITRFLSRKMKALSRKTENNVDDIVSLVIGTFGFKFYIVTGLFVALYFFLNLSEALSKLVLYAFIVFLGVAVLRILFNVVDFLAKIYSEKMTDDNKEITTLLPALRVIGKVVITVIIAIFVLSNLGVDVTALVAGFGIGGLAVAFAFQKILSDLFSTFVIFLDKPFKVGDSVQVDDISGTVEKVGLKTTCLRAFTGEKVVIANEDLANATLHNNSDNPSRRVALIIPIAYHADKEKIRKISGILKGVVESADKTSFTSAGIDTFGEHAILFKLVYRVNDVVFREFVETKYIVSLGIVEALDEHGIEFGYPVDLSLRAKK